jgi:hypothetical protein
MTTSGDPRLPDNETPRLGAFHNATIDPSRQHQGSLTAGAHEYDHGPMPARPEYIRHRNKITSLSEPLQPLYTEKLPKSPAFKSVAELAQRRRDFWSKIVARGGIAMMVAAPVLAVWKGAGAFPAGAFVAGLIIFLAICFVNGNCRSR